MPGAGKSVFVEVATREFNIPAYTMGDVIREETLRRYGVLKYEYMLETARRLREEYGLDYVAVKTYEKIDKSRGVALVDGVRSLAEVEYFRKKAQAVIVAIHASPRTRFDRLVKRGRPGDPRTWEEFVKRDMVELEFGIGNVIALADYMIVNEGDITEAREKSRKVLKHILGGKVEH